MIKYSNFPKMHMRIIDKIYQKMNMMIKYKNNNKSKKYNLKNNKKKRNYTFRNKKNLEINKEQYKIKKNN